MISDISQADLNYNRHTDHVKSTFYSHFTRINRESSVNPRQIVMPSLHDDHYQYLNQGACEELVKREGVPQGAGKRGSTHTPSIAGQGASVKRDRDARGNGAAGRPAVGWLGGATGRCRPYNRLISPPHKKVSL